MRAEEQSPTKTLAPDCFLVFSGHRPVWYKDSLGSHEGWEKGPCIHIRAFWGTLEEFGFELIFKYGAKGDTVQTFTDLYHASAYAKLLALENPVPIHFYL